MNSTKVMMISPNYSVKHWRELDLEEQSSGDWETAADILKDRIFGRFLVPASELIALQNDDERGTYGFAVLALDCLVIETVQAFRKGCTDHTGRSGQLFEAFLTGWDAFKSCAGHDHARKARCLYRGLRCALHHSGQTDNITVRRSGSPMVRFQKGNEIVINRTLFHIELCNEFESYIETVKAGCDQSLRTNFRAKMNHDCGVPNS